MSDTPRTETYVLNPTPEAVPAVWARQLERELNAAQSTIRQQQLLDEEIMRLRDRVKRLEEAGDALQSAVVGTEGMTHWQWLAAAHEADLKWRKAKEAKP